MSVFKAAVKIIGSVYDDAAKLKRAKDQGFKEETYYHGTSDSDIHAFNTDVVYVSKSPKVAALEGGFTDPEQFNKIVGEDAVRSSNEQMKTSVYPLRIRGNLASASDVKNAISTLKLGSASDSRVINYLKEKGFDGMSPSNYETIMFDPKNIRSVNAKFDPSKTDSSNLLSSILTGGVGLSVLNSEKAEQ